MRAVANVVSSCDCDTLTSKWHQLQVLGRRRCVAVDGHEDSAIISQDD